MVVILAGIAGVYLPHGDGGGDGGGGGGGVGSVPLALVGELGAGDTVGEMSLLTGAPVAATVRALRGHVDVLEISHSALARIMSRRPTLVDDLARVIADKAGG